MHALGQPALPRPWRFGLRTLLWATLAAAAALHAIVAFGESPYCRAFVSPALLVAAAPIVGVWSIHAGRLATPRQMVRVSIVVYAASLATPALRLCGELTFGLIALLLGGAGLGLFTDWGTHPEGYWYPVACLLGATANAAFVAGHATMLGSRRRPGRLRWARRWATVGCGLGIAVVWPLAFSTELDALHVGYGLWVASGLLLLLGADGLQRAASSDNDTRPTAAEQLATE